MKHLHHIFVSLIITASLAGCDTSTERVEHKSAFILVNDDSGVLTEAPRAQGLKLLLLGQLKALYKHHRLAKAKLQIISTSFGRPVWVGSITDLKSKRAADIVTRIENNASNCNRLSESFNAVRTSIRQLEQQGYTDIRIYYFSSMISTPSVCDSDVKITLPQLPVPVDFAHALTFSDAVSTIGFYYVNPHQFRRYQEALQPVASWANANGKTFGIFDMEDTEYQLRRGLLGVK